MYQENYDFWIFIFLTVTLKQAYTPKYQLEHIIHTAVVML